MTLPRMLWNYQISKKNVFRTVLWFAAKFRGWLEGRRCKSNFYPIIALIILTLVIVFKRDFGPMKKAEKRTKEIGKLMNEGSKPMLSDTITAYPPK